MSQMNLLTPFKTEEYTCAVLMGIEVTWHPDCCLTSSFSIRTFEGTELTSLPANTNTL